MGMQVGLPWISESARMSSRHASRALGAGDHLL